MSIPYKYFVLIGICFFAVVSCSKNNSGQSVTPPPLDNSPVIKNFSPDSGYVSSVVTITGTNFSADIVQDVVKFNGVQAAVSSATNTEIKVTVPAGTTTGKITLALKTYTATSDHDFKLLQPSWVQKVDFAGGLRIFASGFAVGNKGYLLTGNTPFQGVIAKDLWEYDATTNAWVRKADFPGGPRQMAVGFSVAGKGYVGTGFIYSNPDPAAEHKDLWEYDPAINTWTQKTDMPSVPREYGIAFTIADKAYVGLGGTGGASGSGSSLKDFWQYDPSSDSWTRKADFPGSVTMECLAFAIEGKGYVGLGGNNAGVFSKEVWQFDPVANTWTRKNDFPGEGRQGGMGVAVNGSAYAGFGNVIGRMFGDFWKYNSTNDSWLLQPQFPGGPRSFPVLISVGTKGYLGTGADSSSNGVKDFWQFNP